MQLNLPARASSGAFIRPGTLYTPGHASKRRSQRRTALPELHDLSSFIDVASAAAQVSPLLYERVVLPCSSMSCGDVVYRSTLDPALRGELNGWGWEEFGLIALVLGYLSLPTPGVLQGAIDYYIRAPYKRSTTPAYTKDDVIIRKQLGDGGFGTVFKADLKNQDGGLTPVVLKKAAEFGEAEVWMNERLQLAAPGSCAEFIAAFDEVTTIGPTGKTREELKKAPKTGPAAPEEAVWLMWKYEGDSTLWDLMKNKDFPYNMEPILLGRSLTIPKGIRRKAQIYKVILRQLTEAVRRCHATGIVHRDVKPQNCILSNDDRKIKLIDLGAAADLLLGTNYVPNEFLMDPRYAPPQQYIMSKQVPKPPPKPIAAMLSPVLWFLNGPDRFDVYSLGMTAMQVVFPNLRNDDKLEAFSKRLSECGYDLQEWRNAEVARTRGIKGNEYEEGFRVLDLDGGEGWDLMCQLLSYEPFDRPSASAALAHPFLNNTAFSKTAVARVAQKVSRVMNDGLDILEQGMSGGLERLTEAQLVEMLAEEAEMAAMAEDMPVGEMRYQKSNTVAWWQQRRYEMKRKLAKRRFELGKGIARTMYGISEVVPRKPAAKPAEPKAPAKAAEAKPARPAFRLTEPKPAFRLADTKPVANNIVRAAASAANGAATAPPSPAAVNMNGRALAANGNGNGKALAANGNGNGKALAVNGNGNGKAPSPAPAPPVVSASPTLEKIFELIGRR